VPRSVRPISHHATTTRHKELIDYYLCSDKEVCHCKIAPCGTWRQREPPLLVRINRWQLMEAAAVAACSRRPLPCYRSQNVLTPERTHATWETKRAREPLSVLLQCYSIAELDDCDHVATTKGRLPDDAQTDNRHAHCRQLFEWAPTKPHQQSIEPAHELANQDKNDQGAKK